MKYHKLLPFAFKRFSIVSAVRTALPTVHYYARRTPLPESQKPALCTMNILPPLMRVWWHFAQKNLRGNLDIVIFDCSGKLNPQDFPGARIIKFLNLYAATKCDEFLYHIARHRKIGWICDDDMFFLSPRVTEIVEREFREPNVASVSLRPRPWWHFAIDGKSYPVSSSYCTAINRDIFVDREHLSLAPTSGNTHPSDIGRPPKRYDTFDKANEALLRKGYKCIVLPEDTRKECITGFHGMSNGVMLLNYFHSAQETIDYFLSPPKKQWTGTVLHDAFASMLAIADILELYEKIVGKKYPLPSLPSRPELQKIRQEHEPLLERERSFRWVDEVSERLQSSL